MTQDIEALLVELDACAISGSLKTARLGTSAAAAIRELQREVEYLHRFGNKDCIAMADEAMAKDGKDDWQNAMDRF